MKRIKGNESEKKYEMKGEVSYTNSVEELIPLNLEEARLAINNGIQLCYVNSFPENHGSHEDEYVIHNISGRKESESTYQTVGTGIVHRVFIQPGYSQADKIKRDLQEEIEELLCRIKQDIRRYGFRPTKSLIKKILNLLIEINMYVTLKDIQELYRDQEKPYSDEIKEWVDEIGRECQKQERNVYLQDMMEEDNEIDLRTRS